MDASYTDTTSAFGFEMVKAWCMSGPHQKKELKLVVDPAPFAKFEHLWVQVAATSSWLCPLLSGERHGARPLSRSMLFKALSQAISEARNEAAASPGSAASKLSDELGLDDESTTTSALNSGPGKRRKRINVTVVKARSPWFEIKVPLSPHDSSRVGINAINDLQTLQVEFTADVFNWMLKWVELESRPPPVERAQRPSPPAIGTIFWAPSRGAWMARVGKKTFVGTVCSKGSDGKPLPTEVYKEFMGRTRSTFAKRVQIEIEKEASGELQSLEDVVDVAVCTEVSSSGVGSLDGASECAQSEAHATSESAGDAIVNSTKSSSGTAPTEIEYDDDDTEGAVADEEALPPVSMQSRWANDLGL